MKTVTRLEKRTQGTTDIKEDVCQERVVHPTHIAHVRNNLPDSSTVASIASLFALLGDPTRLQVLYALLHAPQGELCVCDIATTLGRDDTTISHQLRVLRHQQVVAMRKVGRVVYYRLIDEHIRELLETGIGHISEPASMQLQETEVSA